MPRIPPAPSRFDPVRLRGALQMAADFDALYAMLRDAGAGPRLIAGWDAIMHYLNDPPPRGLGLRRVNGKPLTVTLVRGWAKRRGFPLLRGIYEPRGPRYKAVSLERAIDAWVLTRARNGAMGYFYCDPITWNESAPETTAALEAISQQQQNNPHHDSQHASKWVHDSPPPAAPALSAHNDNGTYTPPAPTSR